MKLTLPRFDSQEIDVSPDTIIEFPAGLPGFEQCKRFKLFHQDSVAAPRVHWLQSLDDTDVIFSVTDSRLLNVDYEISLTDAEAISLGVSAGDELCLAILLARPTEGVGAGNMLANTLAPVVINVTKRRALQKSLVNPDLKLAIRG